MNGNIAPYTGRKTNADGYKIYTGTSTAAVQTAEALFSFSELPEKTPLLDEIPLRAFRDGSKPLPLWLWKALARAQWRLGARRQPETRRDSIRRARQAIELAESRGRDCVLITPPFFLRVLAGELERAGYCVEGLVPFGGVKPLDRVRATKKDTHCGGCLHNCPLQNPGCGIGLTKAKDLGIDARR